MMIRGRGIKVGPGSERQPTTVERHRKVTCKRAELGKGAEKSLERRRQWGGAKEGLA